MTTEWRDLPTMQDVAAAQAAGEEIQVKTGSQGWGDWNGLFWQDCYNFRSRPRKQTKTIVLRRALITQDGYYTEVAASDLDYSASAKFVMWLPGEEIVEVPK